MYNLQPASTMYNRNTTPEPQTVSEWSETVSPYDTPKIRDDFLKRRRGSPRHVGYGQAASPKLSGGRGLHPGNKTPLKGRVGRGGGGRHVSGSYNPGHGGGTSSPGSGAQTSPTPNRRGRGGRGRNFSGAYDGRHENAGKNGSPRNMPTSGSPTENRQERGAYGQGRRTRDTSRLRNPSRTPPRFPNIQPLRDALPTVDDDESTIAESAGHHNQKKLDAQAQALHVEALQRNNINQDNQIVLLIQRVERLEVQLKEAETRLEEAERRNQAAGMKEGLKSTRSAVGGWQVAQSEQLAQNMPAARRDYEEARSEREALQQRSTHYYRQPTVEDGSEGGEGMRGRPASRG